MMGGDLIWRENIALANVVLQACLTFVFVRYVWGEMQDGGWRWAVLRKDMVIQAAIALAVLNAGDCLYRVWVWLLIRVYNDGQSNVWVKTQWPWAVLASMMIFVGALCAIRVFSPAKWRHWGWIAAALITVTALVVNMLV